MSTLALTSGPAPAPALPLPAVPVTVRPATVDDLPFIDALQKRHAKQVGWMPRQQLEGKIAAGQVLVAVGATPASPGREMPPDVAGVGATPASPAFAGAGAGAGTGDAGVAPTWHTGNGADAGRPGDAGVAPTLHTGNGADAGRPGDAGVAPTLRIGHAGRPGDAGVAPTGYVIASDRYFKRDDVGIVYQMNVVPGHQRSLIGATLLKAVFDRAAYGCKLFCCWCAQDIAANRFWQAMGFVPLAYRAGSEKKGRVHIFWQKRIRAGDRETPWWFPAKTDAGAMREDRLVLPIPPGRRWGDEMPVLRSCRCWRSCQWPVVSCQWRKRNRRRAPCQGRGSWCRG